MNHTNRGTMSFYDGTPMNLMIQYQNVGYLVISKNCGDGDFSKKKVGKMVILLNCGDGDFGVFKVFFSRT